MENEYEAKVGGLQNRVFPYINQFRHYINQSKFYCRLVTFGNNSFAVRPFSPNKIHLG